jgi:hypothetical protein
MKKISLEEFNDLLVSSALKPRLIKELRFVASSDAISDETWLDAEMVSITDRSGRKGVLVIDTEGTRHLLPYELQRGIASNLTGRAQPIICDLCRTWQTGSRAGSITFPVSKQRTITYLCCADLQCSAHVRSKTSAAKTSRSQLREDMTTEERVARLRTRLDRLVSELRKA